jgi:hypothetical protein
MTAVEYSNAVSATGYTGSGTGTMLITPDDWRADGTKTGVIFCHGYNTTTSPEYEARSPDPSAGIPNMYRLVDAIVRAGFPVISCKNGSAGLTSASPFTFEITEPAATPGGGNGWGNATSENYITQARNYLINTAKAKNGKVLLIGQSMGHIACVRYTRNFKANVAGIVSSMGVADLSNIYANATYTASINTAHGGTWSQASLGATTNPLTIAQAGSLSGVPWQGWYGVSDTTVPKSTSDALVTAIGASASVNYVTGAHDWNAVANWNIDSIIAFLQANQ